MPPETESGAIVFAVEPISTPELKSEERMVLPEPPGVSVKFVLAPVPMVRAPESLKLLAESVCVAPLIESPLMVFVVFAAIIPAIVRFPEVVSEFALEKKLMLPVLLLPSCKVCLFVVARMPLAVSDVDPVVADREAVGVPPATLINANFAELVALEPRRRSCVLSRSNIVPLA